MKEGGDHFRLEALPEGVGASLAHDHEGCPFDGELATRLDVEARAKVTRWVRESQIVVELRLPLEGGASSVDSAAGTVRPPAEVWESKTGASGRRAVEERFREQLEQATATNGAEAATEADRPLITPSGIHNRVLTENLRRFVVGSPSQRIDVDVVYRDGSQASHPFPLRCLALDDDQPASPDTELRLALLSIRHTEMDPVVDGAWLRNADISRPRPAAQTDDLVYETSIEQLDYLTHHGDRSLLLHIYQTGLDTAILGFYRAVVTHMLKHPGNISVVPLFYKAGDRGLTNPEAHFEAGRAWS